MDSSHRRIGIAAAILLAMVAAVLVAPGWINETTRIDASQHVSNLPCGPGQYVTTCPGELVCASGPDDGFSTERVGVQAEGAYCATPVFEQRYCGILEPPQGFDDLTRSVLQCGPAQGLLDIVPILLQTDLDLTDLPARFLNTDGQGAAWIHEQGLELLRTDPDSSEIPIDGYVHCDAAAVSINTASHDQQTSTLSLQVENTGTETLPNMTLAVSYPQQDDDLFQLDGLGPDETTTYQRPVNASPDQLQINLPYCGGKPVGEHRFTDGP